MKLQGLIELMSQRGYFIAEGKVNKVNDMDRKITKFIHENLVQLNTILSAHIIFLNEEGHNEA